MSLESIQNVFRRRFHEIIFKVLLFKILQGFFRNFCRDTFEDSFEHFSSICCRKSTSDPFRNSFRDSNGNTQNNFLQRLSVIAAEIQKNKDFVEYSYMFFFYLKNTFNDTERNFFTYLCRNSFRNVFRSICRLLIQEFY